MVPDSGSHSPDTGAARARLASRLLVTAIAGVYLATLALLRGSPGEQLGGALIAGLLPLLGAGTFFLLYFGEALAEQEGRRQGIQAGEMRRRIRSRALSILSGAVTLGAVYTAVALEVDLWLPRSVLEAQAVLYGAVLLVWLLPSALLAWSPALARDRTGAEDEDRPRGDGGRDPIPLSPPRGRAGRRPRPQPPSREWSVDVIPLHPRE